MNKFIKYDYAIVIGFALVGLILKVILGHNIYFSYLFFLSIGLFLGWLFKIYVNYVLGQLHKGIYGLHIKDYARSTIFAQVKNEIRHIVFKFNHDNKNHDFQLNIKSGDETLLQLLHRSHFPEVCESELDIKFGIAIYIVLQKIPPSKRDLLDKILNEEAQSFSPSDRPYEYYVIDIGKRIKYGGYLVTRILKEVFSVDVDREIKLELFDEGDLAYKLSHFNEN